MHPWVKPAILLTVGSLALVTCGGSPSSPSPVCNITLSSQVADFGSSGGAGSVSVTAPAACSWNATAGASWVTITNGASGTGPGTVSYSLSPNTGTDQRSAALTIGGQTLTVRQQGRTASNCSYALSRELQDFGPGSGSGSFIVSTSAECGWSATSNSPWVVITGGGQGSGNGTVAYSVAANSEIPGRDAMITVADRMFEIRQAGDVSRCEYSLAPVTFDVCMPNGTVQAALMTQASCPWTASSNASWITLPGSESGSGPAVISIAYPDNYDAPRDGVVMVRWPALTAGQNIRLAQAGCTYAVSTTSLSFSSAGGSGMFDVLQQSIPTECGGATQDRCVWTAQSTVPWIVITSSMPRSGDNPVAFSVSANGAAQPRSGQILVRDRVVTITQAAR